MRLLLITLLLTGCGYRKAQTLEPADPLQALAMKQVEYIELERAQRLAGAWEHDCDWLLFASLTASVEQFGELPSIKRAKDKQGAWHRTPARDCYSSGRAASTISRDMLLGLYWYLWRTKDLAELEALARYGKLNDWWMGEPYPGDFRAYLTPNMQSLLYEMIYRLGGEDSQRRSFPQAWGKNLTGYQAHLQVLSILLWGEMRGGINDEMHVRLREHAEREPLNPLFCAAHAIYTGTVLLDACYPLLMDEAHWPAKALPSKANHCEQWPTQRDNKPHDWAPCGTDQELHTGGAFMFIADKILRARK
jgi:hypothetical protein